MNNQKVAPGYDPQQQQGYGMQGQQAYGMQQQQTPPVAHSYGMQQQQTPPVAHSYGMQQQQTPPVAHSYGMQPLQAPPVAPDYDPQQQQGYGMQGQQAYGMQQQMGAPPVYSNQPQHAPPGMVVQPQEWVAPVEAIPGCPPGLEYLTALDQILVKQQIELPEMLTGWEENNTYQIMNNQGQQIYFAAEDTGICMSFCCGPQRSFVIHILNNSNQEVIRLSREFKCCAGNCWCAGSDACVHEHPVEAPVGQIIGYIRQEYSNWQQNFSIRDASHNPILRIHGPCCVFGMACCEDIFKIWSEDDTQELGTICKQGSFFADGTTFGATFPMNLDPKAKAILFGAVFLIDFMYFEKYKNREVTCSV